jgi:cell division protein FtsQ
MVKTQTVPRSENIRRRRSDNRTSTGGRQARRRKSPARSKPPVLVRGEIPMDSMVTPRKRGRTRRRYDIALGIPGAELRLPALPAVRFGWRAVSFFLVAILSMTLYVLWNSPLYRVEQIEIEGLQRLTHHEISAMLGISGEHIFAMDQGKLLADLKTTFPELSTVELKVNLPASVKIVVTERIPVLVWYENGRTLWVDEEGYAMPTREGIEPPALVINAAGAPRISLGENADPNQYLTPEFVQAVLTVREVAPDDRPLLYSVEHGLGWKEKKGWDVFLGLDLKDIELKLRMYDAIKKHLKNAGLKPSLVSVEMIHAPYYRLEP